MSGVSSTSSSTTTQGTLGDVPPITFPGIASGIDYNAIIEKYTAATLLQAQPLETQVNNLTSANTEVLKIQTLLNKLQDSLTALSNPDTFQAYNASVSTTGVATASQITGQQATPGTYTIDAQTPATATTITNNSAANGTVSDSAVLNAAGFNITPTNGSNGYASITVNGITYKIDVTHDSLQTLVNDINGNTATTNVTATLVNDGTSNEQLQLTTTGGTSLAIGSGNDQGNLLQVLHLDTAQIQNLGGGNQQITSATNLGGINPNADVSSSAAGFSSTNPAVTAGFFTLNGVQISVSATESINDIISAINQSTAGVSASFNTATDSIVLASTQTGPQNIVLGSSTDTSNFLVVSGLAHLYGNFTTGNGYTDVGANAQIGTQGSVTYTTSTGAQKTVYNASNTFSNVIPGVNLDITAATTSANPYTVTVSSNPKTAESALNAFVTAYNNVINELNKATKAPTISASSSVDGSTTSSQTSSGGPLYNDFEISQLRDQLVSMVSGFVPSGSDAYNSLSSLGLQLDTGYVSSGTTTDSSDSSDDDSDSNYVQAATGLLAALDTTTFEAALAANPAAISNIFSSKSGIAYSIGSYLTDATGLPTILSNGIAGTVPVESLLNTVTDSNTQQIDSLKQQITLINQEANQQADQLRSEYSASETQIAELLSLQNVIAAIGH